MSLNNLEGDRKLQKEILEIFKHTLCCEIINIKKAYKLKDWSVLEKAIHKLKGSAAYGGAMRLDFVCQNFLKYYLMGQIECLDSLYQVFEATLESTYRPWNWLNFRSSDYLAVPSKAHSPLKKSPSRTENT